MMRLKTNSLPATPFLKGWHIHRVDDPRMFYWNEVGHVRMDGDFIPGQTVIDIVSHVPNFHVLRSMDQSARTKSGSSVGSSNGHSQSKSPWLQIPDNQTKSRLVELSQQWTQGHSSGWNQVEAIVNKMRSEFTLSPAMVAPADGGDTVGSFLDQQGGPSYLFATTATQLLRAAGYRTRLVSGFLVEEKHYDRVANQSEVTADNLHMWPEVCLDGWHWIPVEPTPGYPIPFSYQTTWQWFQAQFAGLVRWVTGNPVYSALLAGLVVCLFRFRRDLIAFGGWLAWSIASRLFPGRRLALTRKLIDMRFWAAGLPRPHFQPVADWFSQVDQDSGQEFYRFWRIQNYRSRPIEKRKRHEVAQACSKFASTMTLQRIKSYARNSNSKVDE